MKKETLEEAKQVGQYQQELFNYLHDLGVTALQSEMEEIERIVLSMQQERMYSEEDMIRFANIYSNLDIDELHLKYFNNLPRFKK